MEKYIINSLGTMAIQLDNTHVRDGRVQNNIIVQPNGAYIGENSGADINNYIRTYNFETTNITDVGFVDSSVDFHLLDSSLAIDSGTDLSEFFSMDKDNLQRVLPYDQGA